MPVSDKWTISSSKPVRSPLGVNCTFPVIPSNDILKELINKIILNRSKNLPD